MFPNMNAVDKIKSSSMPQNSTLMSALINKDTFFYVSRVFASMQSPVLCVIRLFCYSAVETVETYSAIPQNMSMSVCVPKSWFKLQIVMERTEREYCQFSLMLK
jgi:hypothetical protein